MSKNPYLPRVRPTSELRIKTGTTVEWEEDNVVLKEGEPGYNSETRELKVGDGVHHWIDLPVLSTGGPVVTESVAILSGNGAPTPDLGLTGYWYFDLDSWDVFEKTDAITWVSRGNIKGEPGPQGPQGIPGDGTAHLSFSQAVPAATWTWVHNLNTNPPVILFRDSEPTKPVYTDVEYPDLNTVVITWPSPETGWVYI